MNRHLSVRYCFVRLWLYMEKQIQFSFCFLCSVLDDYYILYTLLYHDFNIQLVTRDLLRDHLYHLDSASRVDFQRWQTSNQFMLESFTNENQPVFSVRTNPQFF